MTGPFVLRRCLKTYHLKRGVPEKLGMLTETMVLEKVISAWVAMAASNRAIFSKARLSITDLGNIILRSRELLEKVIQSDLERFNGY